MAGVDVPDARRLGHSGDRGQSIRRDWLLVDASDSMYADTVVSDLTDIFGTRSGRALLRGIHARGMVVTIERPTPTQPPNAWVHAAGQPTDAPYRVLLAYDPVDWPSAIDDRSPPSDAMLFALLQDAFEGVESGSPTADVPSASPLYDSDAVADYRRERDRA